VFATSIRDHDALGGPVLSGRLKPSSKPVTGPPDEAVTGEVTADGALAFPAEFVPVTTTRTVELTSTAARV
jgi:hypothetical protein